MTAAAVGSRRFRPVLTDRPPGPDDPSAAGLLAISEGKDIGSHLEASEYVRGDRLRWHDRDRSLSYAELPGEFVSSHLGASRQVTLLGELVELGLGLLR
jgi:hypothetical protein